MDPINAAAQYEPFTLNYGPDGLPFAPADWRLLAIRDGITWELREYGAPTTGPRRYCWVQTKPE